MIGHPTSSAGSPIRRQASSRPRQSIDDYREPPREPALDRPDRVDAIIAFLAPTIDDILSAIEGDEFTTPSFIALLAVRPGGERRLSGGARAAGGRATGTRRWWSTDRSSRESCAGQTSSSGSGLPMAKTIPTRYRRLALAVRGAGRRASERPCDHERWREGTCLRLRRRYRVASPNRAAFPRWTFRASREMESL